jgi:hypothetical protein
MKPCLGPGRVRGKGIFCIHGTGGGLRAYALSEHFWNTRRLFLSGVQGGFFLRKKPLSLLLSVCTHSENAMSLQADERQRASDPGRWVRGGQWRVFHNGMSGQYLEKKNGFLPQRCVERAGGEEPAYGGASHGS